MFHCDHAVCPGPACRFHHRSHQSIGLFNCGCYLAQKAHGEVLIGSTMENAGFNATGGFRTGIVAAPLTAKVVAQCVVNERTDVDTTPFLAARFHSAKAVRI